MRNSLFTTNWTWTSQRLGLIYMCNTLRRRRVGVHPPSGRNIVVN